MFIAFATITILLLGDACSRQVYKIDHSLFHIRFYEKFAELDFPATVYICIFGPGICTIHCIVLLCVYNEFITSLEHYCILKTSLFHLNY